ncbi:MAG: winged helix-turn-helix domain-containing protein [Pseudohongiellaceae bacterium]
MPPLNDFYINNIRVDADRCRVFRDDKVIALEPKVVQVLLFLARHPGEVVTHQTLLDNIWAGTVVEASALQRCIAQLRKAFLDDARQQRIIATYPKRGYSLVGEISWQNTESTAPVISHRAWLPAAMVVLVAVASLMLLTGRNAGLSVDSTDALTASATTGRAPVASLALQNAIADPDSFPVYSPDGRFVVYPRFLEERKAHLWARDLAYGNDFMLTEEAGIYEHLAWSGDSSRLVFVDATCLLDHCSTSRCASLKSVSISQSETNILSVQKLIDCSPSRLLSPEWLGPRELAVIEVSENTAALVSFDLASPEQGEQDHSPDRQVLYQSSNMLPYHLSYSRQTGVLTIMAINPEGRKELLFMDTRTGTVNHNETAVFLPDDNWYPSAVPF